MRNAKLDEMVKRKELEKIFKVNKKKRKTKWNKMKIIIKFIVS